MSRRDQSRDIICNGIGQMNPIDHLKKLVEILAGNDRFQFWWLTMFSFGDDLLQGVSADPFHLNLPYITEDYRSYYLQNEAAFAVDPNSDDAVLESNFEDFDSDENIYSFYVMTEISSDESYSLILGGRVEHTVFETQGFRADEDTGELVKTYSDKDYTNWLPGIHYRYNLSEDLIFRASWTNTLARQIFPESLDLEEGVAEEAEFGNPDLDPYTASNFDASIEYYLPTLGVLSAAIFHKSIEDFIYEQVSFDDTVEIGDGSSILVEEFAQFRNGESGSITGIELAYQQQFSMLPDPWDGFSLWTNVTLSESEADVQVGDEEGTRTADFLKQSDVVGSVALSYEKYGFFFRVSGSYRSEYLDEYEEGGNDRIVDNFFQWDVSSSYQFSEQLSVFANFINVNNEPFVAYWADDGRLSQFEEYSWSANFGIKFTY